jgi:chitinase
MLQALSLLRTRKPLLRLTLLLCAFLASVLSMPVLNAQEAAKASPRLLAYYPDWAKFQVPHYSADQIPYRKITHIAHAFLLLKKDGKGGLFIEDSLLEPALISKAHAAGVKVLISIGGADPHQAAAFAKIAAHDAYRRTFAANLHNFIAKNGYDGADIDWEVPNAPEDTQPCIMLMQELRNEMPAGQLLLSMAVPSDPRSYGTGFDIPALAPLVDFFNVMTYDFHGPWTDHDGHNSPFILSYEDPEQEGSVVTSMDLYEREYGVPRAQLNMGTAFYGYQFNGVSALWQFCRNNDCSRTTSQNYGTYIKQRINQKDFVRHYDPIAQEPYLTRDTPGLNPVFITYDDSVSTRRKVRYVIGERHFGGVFMWDLSADYDGQTQDLLNSMYWELLKLNP